MDAFLNIFALLIAGTGTLGVVLVMARVIAPQCAQTHV